MIEKLGLLFKNVSEDRIKKNFKTASSVFVIKYSGLSGPDLNNLRQSLRDSRAEFLVIRNNIAKRALKGLSKDELLPLIDGPCGLVFINEEPVSVSKVLYNFAKEHENLKIFGGLLDARLINKQDIESLAKLPSKEVLRAQLVMTMKSPINGLVGVLKGNLRKLVYCLEQIKGKKQ